MNNITDFIQEKLKITKDIKVNDNILQTILDVIKPKYEDVTNYLKEWIKKENIKRVEIYVIDYVYKQVLKYNYEDKDLIKSYNSDNINGMNDKCTINRNVYSYVRNNWHFIGKDEGLGYWKNYFGYISSNKKLFSSQSIYIVGID